MHDQHEAAGKEPARQPDRPQRATRSRPPEASATSRRDRERQRMERVRDGESQREHARDAETGRHAGEEVLVATSRQRPRGAQRHQADRAARRQHDGEQHAVDHSIPPAGSGASRRHRSLPPRRRAGRASEGEYRAPGPIASARRR
jgi:hypothetical protein